MAQLVQRLLKMQKVMGPEATLLLLLRKKELELSSDVVALLCFALS